MKTTEVFVEQVLIGFVVLVIGALPFGLGEVLANLTNGGLFMGIGVIGIAYLLGIPADRIADTLLSGLERRNRAGFALQCPEADGDPFPEDSLKINVMQNGGPAWDWMEYLRSRIRIVRALTAFGPALTVSAALAAWDEVLHPWALGVGLGSTLLVYIVALFLVPAQTLPRTSEIMPEQKAHLVWWRDPFCWLSSILVVLGIAVGVAWSSIVVFGVGLGGLLFTLLAGWTWWRVTLTFMRFLRDFGEHGKKSGTPGGIIASNGVSTEVGKAQSSVRSQ